MMRRSSTMQSFKKYSETTIKTVLQIQNSRTTTKLCSIKSSFLSTLVQNDPNIIRSRLPDITIPTSSLYDIIWDGGINKFGNKIATVRK